ncbi:MAG TPA: hypothetical protein VN515_02255 [Terriglobales bacterium]|nr:hypothetical protein [Terriglobales bacterium]
MSEEERIPYLVSRCEAIADPELRADMLELFGRVMALHERGLRRLLAAAAGAPHLEAARAAWERAPEVAALLELHGLDRADAVELWTSPPPSGGGSFVRLETLATGRANAI